MKHFKRILALVFLLSTIIFSFTSPLVQARHHEKENNTINKTPGIASSPIPVDTTDNTTSNTANQLPNNDFKNNISQMKKWPIERIDKGGTLIFSDSPETVYNDGILYEDTVEGNGRLYYYHVNGTTASKKIVVMLKNMDDKNVNFDISRSANAGPSADYLYVGKMSQVRYFGYQVPENINLFQGQSKILDTKAGNMVIKKDQLVCGIYDFKTNGKIKITVAMMPIYENPQTFLKTAHYLPTDSSRLRGTFSNMDRILRSKKAYNPEKDGTVYFRVADDNDDKYLTGIDATDGSQVKNYGNYGVLYYFELPVVGMQKAHYYLQPLGGVYAGAVAAKMNNERSLSVFPTPAERSFFGENSLQTYFADLGTYGRKDDFYLQYSPPGASNLPVNIIMMPAEN